MKSVGLHPGRADYTPENGVALLFFYVAYVVVFIFIFSVFLRTFSGAAIAAYRPVQTGCNGADHAVVGGLAQVPYRVEPGRRLCR